MPIAKGKGGLPMNRPTHGNRGNAPRPRSGGRNMAGRKAGKVGKGPGK